MKQQRGFIALISAIIISMILLLVITDASLTSFYGRFNVLDSEYKERSSALADACVDTLLLRLADGQNPTGTIAVGTDQCQIVTSTNPYAIQAIYQNSYTNLQITLNNTSLAIVSWVEVP